MRKIELQNQDILEALERKDVLTAELNALAKQEEDLMANANALVAKLTKENEKVIPLIKEELAKVTLEEFEEHSRTYLGKDEEAGKVFMEIADRLEEFKEGFKQRNEQNNNSNTPAGDGHSGDNAEKPTKGSKKNPSKG